MIQRNQFITFCKGLQKYFDSILPIIDAGGKMIIQNGGAPVRLENNMIQVYDEKDQGIYDALNKGISKVRTKFFMLIHAGDIFIGKPEEISKVVVELENTFNSMSLNSQYIGSRLHSSRNWRPWMLNLGVQPPHLPIIYRSKIFKHIEYSLDIPIIADFDFFLKKVDWNNVSWNNKVLVKMETGGATSSGIQSFFFVSRCFSKTYGIKGFIMALTRIPFKFLQAIN